MSFSDALTFTTINVRIHSSFLSSTNIYWLPILGHAMCKVKKANISHHHRAHSLLEDAIKHCSLKSVPMPTMLCYAITLEHLREISNGNKDGGGENDQIKT